MVIINSNLICPMNIKRWIAWLKIALVLSLSYLWPYVCVHVKREHCGILHAKTHEIRLCGVSELEWMLETNSKYVKLWNDCITGLMILQYKYDIVRILANCPLLCPSKVKNERERKNNNEEDEGGWEKEREGQNVWMECFSEWNSNDEINNLWFWLGSKSESVHRHTYTQRRLKEIPQLSLTATALYIACKMEFPTKPCEWSMCAGLERFHLWMSWRH